MNDGRAKAQLSVRLWLDCPWCDEQLDLMEIDVLNDEGQMMSMVCRWNRDEWKNPGYMFDCPECEKTITLSEVEY